MWRKCNCGGRVSTYVHSGFNLQVALRSSDTGVWVRQLGSHTPHMHPSFGGVCYSCGAAAEMHPFVRRTSSHAPGCSVAQARCRRVIFFGDDNVRGMEQGGGGGAGGLGDRSSAVGERPCGGSNRRLCGRSIVLLLLTMTLYVGFPFASHQSFSLAAAQSAGK